MIGESWKTPECVSEKITSGGFSEILVHNTLSAKELHDPGVTA